jgi:hypothetical protein
MSTNRREFLKRTGGLALTGWVGSSGLAAAAAVATNPAPAAPASRGVASIERWLLETGRPTLGEDIYRAVADGKV